MLREFLDGIANLATRANAVEVVDASGRFGRKALVRVGGAMEWVEIPAPLPCSLITSFDDMCDAIRDSVLCPDPEVYCSPYAISVVCDRVKRDSFMTMGFEATTRWNETAALSDRGPMTQRTAIRFMREDLDVRNDKLLAALRRIDFKRISQSGGVIEHGKETLGRSVEAAILNIDEIPDVFTLRVAPFGNEGLQDIVVDIKCWIYIDIEERNIEVGTFPDEILGARRGATRTINGMLRTLLPGIPVFQGEHNQKSPF
jgi:hypothetical protein